MKRTFYIAEPDRILSMDLAGALEAQFPMSTVLVEPSLHDLAGLHPSDRICIFARPAIIGDQDLNMLRRFVEAGSQAIVIGGGKDFGLPVTELEQPFTNEMILEAVSNSEVSRAETPDGTETGTRPEDRT